MVFTVLYGAVVMIMMMMAMIMMNILMRYPSSLFFGGI
jgi:hypothetical protein